MGATLGAFVWIALGLLFLTFLVRDLKQGTTRLGGTPYRREHEPVIYWVILWLLGSATAMLLGGGSERLLG